MIAFWDAVILNIDLQLVQSGCTLTDEYKWVLMRVQMGCTLSQGKLSSGITIIFRFKGSGALHTFYNQLSKRRNFNKCSFFLTPS